MMTYAPMHMTSGDLILCMREVCCCGENVYDGKPACGCTRILADSARKRKEKKLWRIIIKQHMPPTWPLDGIEGSVDGSNSC
jgi:hypothetical protein